jgi:hypothetical protein
MNENIKWIACAVAVVGLAIGAVVYRDKWWRDKPPPPPAEPSAVVAPPPAMPEEPDIKHPLAAPEGPEPLPPLAESDAPLQNAIETLIGKESLERLVVSEDLIRRFVVTVDNLTTEKVAERLRPLQPIPGKFSVRGADDAPVLDPANYERYQLFVQAIRSMDTQRVVATYVRYYPLFQEQYESLGHPPQYFNDRLVEVIDDLLATPDLTGPVKLARPNVQYEFADPALEARSAGQKALLRMGPAHAKDIKDKLRELRGELVAQKPGT